jgi:hypothetical protein
MYTTKSAYEIHFDGSSLSMFPTMIWKVWALARCKFFSWLLLQSRIWTADRLLVREWPNDYFCPLCRRNLETVIHLFQECSYARQVWLDVSNWALVQSFHLATWKVHAVMHDWFCQLCNVVLLNSVKRKGARSLAILICWTIWKERNARVFDQCERSMSSIVPKIKSEVSLWTRARNKNLARLVEGIVSE